MVFYVDSSGNIQNVNLKDKRFTGIPEDLERLAVGCQYQGNQDYNDWEMKHVAFYSGRDYVKKISIHSLICKTIQNLNIDINGYEINSVKFVCI